MNALSPTALDRVRYHAHSSACSVLFACFEGSPFLLCGLGDGQLLNWRLERGGMLGK